jgi:hypothetical protein
MNYLYDSLEERCCKPFIFIASLSQLKNFQELWNMLVQLLELQWSQNTVVFGAELVMYFSAFPS